MGTPSQQFEGYRQIPTNTISFDGTVTPTNDYRFQKRVVDKKTSKGNSALKSPKPSWVVIPSKVSNDTGSDKE